MNIAIRADASNIIGTGHIMRCLALAEALQKEAFTVFFICRDLPYNLSELIEDKGFQCYLLPFS
ncbi:MAG: UDP-2,4-diacetamido-2,4,6-trideoxy-beta-L-altropyranose hydrolase, partial [bacterium]|nr:UDP-2,4-diacetamido-2,4,6-trideoxy-beta-L-altropyranose hydrolase [bacterium]